MSPGCGLPLRPSADSTGFQSTAESLFGGICESIAVEIANDSPANPHICLMNLLLNLVVTSMVHLDLWIRFESYFVQRKLSLRRLVDARATVASPPEVGDDGNYGRAERRRRSLMCHQEPAAQHMTGSA